MKKKLFAIICCLAMVLTGGITGLVLGCGNTPKAEQVAVAPTLPDQPDFLPEQNPEQNPENKEETSKPNVAEDNNTNPNAIEGRKNYTRSAVSSITGGKRVTPRVADAFKLRTYITFEFILVGTNIQIKLNEMSLVEGLDYTVAERNGIKIISGKYMVTGAEKNIGSQSYIDVLYTGNYNQFNVNSLWACQNLYHFDLAEYNEEKSSYDANTRIVSVNFTNTSTSNTWINFFTPFTNTFKTNTTYTMVLETWDVTSVASGSISMSSPYDANEQGDITPGHVDFSLSSAQRVPVQAKTFTTVSDFSKCYFDFRSYIFVPAGKTANFKFRVSLYEGKVNVDDNLYDFGLNVYSQNDFSYNASSGLIAINKTNSSTTSREWYNFNISKTKGLRIKASTTYTFVVRAYDVVSGWRLFLSSPGGNGDYGTLNSSFFVDKNISADGVYKMQFTTRSNLDDASYAFYSFFECMPSATINMKFTIQLYEGAI